MFNNFFRSLAGLLAAGDPALDRAMKAGFGAGGRRKRSKQTYGAAPGDRLRKPHRALMNDGHIGRVHASTNISLRNEIAQAIHGKKLQVPS